MNSGGEDLGTGGLARDAKEPIGSVPAEGWVSEGRLEAGKTDSVEVVQVQLSHETCKIAVFEVFG